MNTITIDITELNLATIKLLVTIRDKYSCQIHQLLDLDKCQNNNIEIHHIVPIKEKGTDNPSNLISLCEKHHQIIHCHQINKQILGLKLLLIENSISQKELATALNITQSAVAQMLQRPASQIKQAIKIKDYIQNRTGKVYSLEKLFQLVETKKPV